MMTEADECMLLFKENIKFIMNTSPYFVKPEIVNKGTAYIHKITPARIQYQIIQK
jgi:hypothetical protein